MKQFILMVFLVVFPFRGFGQRYLFYLHGKILEDQGIKAIDTTNGFGVYQYEDILNAFRKKHFVVLSEVRNKNTDQIEYAHKIANQIEVLMNKGIRANDITVVGASKGATISMLVSSFLNNTHVNFVFLAGCNEEIMKRFPEIKFCGNILSIYEKSDDIGHSCLEFKSISSLTISHYKEIELNTGLRHGFIYKPLAEWIDPTLKWASGNY